MTVETAVPALADDLASPALEPDSSWSVERAEAAFFERLRTDQNSYPASPSGRAKSEPAGRRFTCKPSQIPWVELWMPFAACVLLAIALGIVAYRTGLSGGTQTNLQQLQCKADTLNQQREDTAKQAQALQAKVDELTQLAHESKRSTSSKW
jgi:hypothetical protein